jgi:diacylglycerol kinase family enzyme
VRRVRALVVVNPRATTTSERQRDVLAHALGSIAHLQIELTRNRGHAAALACRAMRDGVELVVALGGDGTVNEVVNGLLTDGVHPGVPAFGVVPGGSTNVFARTLGLPNDPMEATGILLDAVRHNRRRPVSMARADERWFTFAAGIGLDAGIIARVEKHRGRGRTSTDALYARAGLREFYSSDRSHPHISIELPDGEVVEGLYMAVITNTDPWTYLGERPLRPTPEASFEGGLDVYARRSMRAPGVLWAMAQMARRKPRSPGRGGVLLHDVERFVLRSDVALPFQVDGDLMGPQQVIAFSSTKAALSVML